MWIEKCHHCQESVIIQTEFRHEIYNFFGVLTSGKFHWCVNFALWHFSADVDKDVYISYTAVANYESSVFVRF